MRIVALHLRSVPDLEAGRRLLGLTDLGDKDVLKAVEHVQRQRGAGEFGAARRCIAALSLLRADEAGFELVSLRADGADEEAMLQAVADEFGSDATTLLSWNGSADDLPLLRTRALIRGVPLPVAFEAANHVELAAALGGTGADAAEIAALCGMPHLRPLPETAARDAALAGDYLGIGAECDCAVVQNYLLYLRLRYVRGEIDAQAYGARELRLRVWLREMGHTSLFAYAEAWQHVDDAMSVAEMDPHGA